MTELNISQEQLGSLVRTVDERNILLWQFEEIEKKLYKSSFSLKDSIQELPYTMTETLLTILGNTLTEKPDKDSMKHLLSIIQDAIKNMPVISLTLATVPSGTLVDSMEEWFLETYKIAVIFEFSYDLSLIGGAIIGSNGHIKDYSLKQKIKEYMHG